MSIQYNIRTIEYTNDKQFVVPYRSKLNHPHRLAHRNHFSST